MIGCSLTCLKVWIAIVAVLAAVSFYFKRYLVALYRLVTLLVTVKLHGINNAGKVFSYVDLIEKKVDERPSHIQFISAESGKTLTLKEMDDICNQIAHWGQKKGLKQLDTIALMLLNHPHYICIWLGLSKIGVKTALLNTNTTGKPFKHGVDTALSSSEVKILIVDIQLRAQLTDEIAELTSRGIQVFFWGEGKEPTDTITPEVLSLPTNRPSRDARNKVTEREGLVYIFTSGTTGLPKACKISQTRYFMASVIYPTLCALNKTDIIYTPLPLYHSAGGMLGVGGALLSGTTIVIRKKFSASNFTADCLKYKVTSVQYIGELCRFLVVTPPNELDKQLKLRSAFGNGMRLEYWEKFKNRYNVDVICEFYAATEGNVGLFNTTNHVGALGFVPRIFDFIYPIRIIRTDPDDQTVPYRNAQGFCEVCAPGEVGLLVAPIGGGGSDPSRRFDGYTDSKATNSKIINGVFRSTDSYFNTGDLIMRDIWGFFYWSDRIGDTFRWKGENVSTTEVSQVVSDVHDQVKDVVVYGVEVPNADGRAGMAAILTMDEVGHSLDVEKIAKHCSKELPTYARPLFLRVKVDNKLPMTATHKYIKADLVKEGFNPSEVRGDILYYYNAKGNQYSLLTPEVYQDIQHGKIRF